MSADQMIPELTAIITDALHECIARGLELPFVLTAVGVNGSVIAVRIPAKGNAPEFLAEDTRSEGFAAPVNIMVVDRRGEAVRIVITADGARRVLQ